MRWLGAVFSILLLGGCTTIGLPDADERASLDYGPPRTLKLCVLRDDGVSEAGVRDLTAAIGREMAPYGLIVETAWSRPWSRPGFTVEAILGGVNAQPLEPPCDRLLALVGRNIGDTLWGFVLPEVLGAVETATHTKGYVVAVGASPNQIFSGPESTAVHEFYHLLGCPHGLGMRNCYRQVARIKKLAGPDGTFFPGIDPQGRPIRERAEVEARLRGASRRTGAGS